ncbi:MAG: GHMP kinase [Termitinemataceae bacterium]|nr:MAG: GHMP kinase [Termitinemataceae bacterium]
MVIVRSPLRITLGGGGTDLPSYYKKHNGYLIAAAIDKYVYIAINPAFTENALLKYSQYERVSSIDEIQHRIIRECMRETETSACGIEICSLADIPAGTGLGSSGSFTTALLKALYAYNNKIISPRFLAESAVMIELEKLGEPIGKQDQYIAAFGGVTEFEFLPNERVEISPLSVSKETLYELEDSLMLFFTGYSRSASGILREQDDKSREGDDAMTQNLHFVKELGLKSKAALENGRLTEFGRLMNTHWEYKRKRSGSMSNPKIDKWYDMAIKNGAIGGKLIGAGGGGFLMFFAEDRAKLRKAMTEEGLQEVRFRFDFEGTKVLVQ